MQAGEAGQGLAADRAADPGKRDGRADGFAHDHFLAVRFSEFIAIMTADPARARIDQRDHRKLDHPGALDQPVEHGKLERVDDIFRIVEHDCFGGAAVGGFGVEQSGVEMVEAVGLGRRSIDVERYYVANAPTKI